MSIDYFSCSGCENTFPDCSYYFVCATCEHSFCSDKCGDKILIEEEYFNEKEDRYIEEENSCKLCRKEEATDNQLLNCLLEHYGISYDDAMKIYKGQK